MSAKKKIETTKPSRSDAPTCSAFFDDDDEPVREGDTIQFAYGIPPVSVIAKVVSVGGKLWVLTPGHNPEKCLLCKIREYTGGFYKQNASGDARRPGAPLA
jgi:hypothetical protein